MRPVVCGLAAGLLACHAARGQAQQGIVQISGAGQTITGGTLQPATTPSSRTSACRGSSRASASAASSSSSASTKRADRLHVGRNYAALRDLKRAAVSWTLRSRRRVLHPRARRIRILQSHHSRGHLQRRRNQRPARRGALHVVGGRATAWRNIFGTDPDTLATNARHGARVVQGVRPPGGVRPGLAHPDVGACASSASPSPTAGRPAAAPVHAGAVRAADRRRLVRPVPAARLERSRSADGSFLTGASFLLPHGWVQVNVARFSPGEFPAMNDPMHDRESAFAAGEYDFVVARDALRRLGDRHHQHRSGQDAALVRPTCRATPRRRGFGGVRVRLGTRSNVTLRLEEGDRIAARCGPVSTRESDTGAAVARNGRCCFGPMTTYARVARRQNIDSRRPTPPTRRMI